MIEEPFRCAVCRRLGGSFRVELPGTTAYLCETCLHRVETSDRPYQWRLWLGMIGFACLAALLSLWLLAYNIRRGQYDLNWILVMTIVSPALFWWHLQVQKRIHATLKAGVQVARGHHSSAELSGRAG